MFFARLLQERLDSLTIVVITDRNDLDDQLFGQFSRCVPFRQCRGHLSTMWQSPGFV